MEQALSGIFRETHIFSDDSWFTTFIGQYVIFEFCSMRVDAPLYLNLNFTCFSYLLFFFLSTKTQLSLQLQQL